MEWLYGLVICVCAAGLIAALFSGLTFDSGLFRCVGLVVSLVMCVFVASSLLKGGLGGFFDGIDFDFEQTDTTIYADGILDSFTDSLENNIEKSINEKYKGANAGVYAIAQINDSYEIEVLTISVTVSEGDSFEILKLINEEYNIEKNKIYIQRE